MRYNLNLQLKNISFLIKGTVQTHQDTQCAYNLFSNLYFVQNRRGADN